jgi:hypothetical protein
MTRVRKVPKVPGVLIVLGVKFFKVQSLIKTDYLSGNKYYPAKDYLPARIRSF